MVGSILSIKSECVNHNEMHGCFIVSIKSECDHSEINDCLCSELKFILALFSTTRNDGFQAENGRSK